jgi:hypothetical protein
MATAQRGSAELLKQHPLREADLKALHKALSEEELEILHWFPRGTPNPEVIYGAVRTRPEVAGSVVASLIKNQHVRLKLDVFPYGVPVIDEIIIGFETQQGFGG